MMTTVDEKIWFYLDQQNQQKGPFSEKEIHGFYLQGILHSESFIWKAGLENWQSINSIFPYWSLQPSTLSFDREPAPVHAQSPFSVAQQTAAHTPLRDGQYQRVQQGRKLSTKEILFSFEGRLPRKPFWLTTLFIVIAAMVLGILFAVMVPAMRNGGGTGLGFLLAIISLPALVAFVWAGIAMGVKRLHDQNLTGWFYLISFIPYVGSLILLVMYCIKGTDGANKYGEDTRHLY
jgi:uncharacterized membrane protein YhaH (DUF805 family)